MWNAEVFINLVNMPQYPYLCVKEDYYLAQNVLLYSKYVFWSNLQLYKAGTEKHFSNHTKTIFSYSLPTVY